MNVALADMEFTKTGRVVQSESPGFLFALAGLSCIRAKFTGITESTIMLQSLVMNLDRRLRIL